MRDTASVPLLPTDILDLKCMVCEALASIMVKVWRELEYRINASHINCRAHIISKVYTKLDKFSISLYMFNEHHITHSWS
jgi:hypothetical protein